MYREIATCDCAVIKEFERELDARATRLDMRVNAVCADVRVENRQSWERFAAVCTLPLIGEIYFRWQKMPTLLEEPDYRKEAWYRSEVDIIHAGASTLERMKRDHLEHYGQEMVEPADFSDPGWMTREECYAKNFVPFFSSKYDYHSAAGLDKLLVGRYAMDAVSKRIVPEAMCDWLVGESTSGKPIYRLCG